MISKLKKNICSIIAFSVIVLLLAVISFIGLDSEAFGLFLSKHVLLLEAMLAHYVACFS